MEKSLIHENNFGDEESFCLVCLGTFSKSKPEEIWVQCIKSPLGSCISGLLHLWAPA